jgi:hypothetical protein
MSKFSDQDKTLSPSSVIVAIENLTDPTLTQAVLVDNLSFLRDNLSEAKQSGYGYLENFIQKYFENPDNYKLAQGANAVARMILSSIASPAELQEILKNIADGKMNSLSNAVPIFDFTLTNNIRNMAKYSPDDKTVSDQQRAYQGAISTLSAKGINATEAKSDIDKILEKHPIIIGVLGISDSLSRLNQDMWTIISNGSNGTPENHAARYLKMQKFEKEVKEKVVEFAGANKLDTKEAQDFLKEKSAEGIKHLMSNYEHGMTLNQSAEAVKAQMGLFTMRMGDVANGNWQNLPKNKPAAPVISAPVANQPKGLLMPPSPWEKFKNFIKKISEKFKNNLRPKNYEPSISSPMPSAPTEVKNSVIQPQPNLAEKSTNWKKAVKSEVKPQTHIRLK